VPVTIVPMRRPPARIVAAWCCAIALAVLSTAALTPKVTAPSSPPNLILNCLDILPSRSGTTIVQVWNSGIVQERSVDTWTFTASVTFARIDILTDRSRHPTGFREWHHVIDRVSGDMRFEIRFVDGDGQPVSPPPEVKPSSVAIAHCEATQRKF
jgi:hypothetical protein